MDKWKAGKLVSSVAVSAALMATTVAISTPAGAQSGSSSDGFMPGESYFGTDDYIEYLPGNLPVVFAAPHAGSLTPTSIPVRTPEICGSDGFALPNDFNTQNLAREIRAAFVEHTGMYPHVIINRLSRNRMDANRPIGMAACGNAEAELAWTEFHEFIDIAKDQIEDSYDKGWFIDIHGHGNAVQRIELGYNIDAATLRLADDVLDGDPGYEAGTTFRVFSEESPASFTELLRGPTSFGTLLEGAGYPATPSQQDPAPAQGEAFSRTEYNTLRHGCLDGGQICGVQIEHHRSMRETELLAPYADALYGVLDEYLLTNFGILVQSPAQGLGTLAAQVDDLVRSGDLSKGHGVALTAKLDAAKQQLGHDNPSAENTINAFIHHVEGLSHSGDISATNAAQLTTLAERVIQLMHASG